MNVEIADIKKLNLGPNDCLVVHVDRVISAETVRRIREQFAAGLPNVSFDRLLIIDRTISLSVVTDESGQNFARDMADYHERLA